MAGDGELTVLRVDNIIADADAFYAELVALHAGLDTADSLKLCAKLILLLANEVGDRDKLDAILAAVRAQRVQPRSSM